LRDAQVGAGCKPALATPRKENAMKEMMMLDVWLCLPFVQGQAGFGFRIRCPTGDEATRLRRGCRLASTNGKSCVGSVSKFKLSWTDEHYASHYGLGVLLDSSGEVLSGMAFRWLRDSVGAWIESNDPPRTAWALGVPKDERGIWGLPMNHHERGMIQ